MWTRAAADRQALRATHASRYLSDAPLPESVRIAESVADATADDALVLVATSTAGLRETCAALGTPPPAGLLWACKGFEQDTRCMPHEIVAQALPGATRIGALSGPSFADEVARGLPTALVIASHDAQFARQAMAALNQSRLRVYSSTDVVGVELGGAVKNVVAIAAGIADGLELGRNARAALVTRGLAEIVRLGIAMGGHAETFMGLAGLGDLVLTCTGELSRNREVGLGLARGETLQGILDRLGHVAEGVRSADAVVTLAATHHVEMPIAAAVHRVLFGGLGAREAVGALLSRDPRPELR